MIKWILSIVGFVLGLIGFIGSIRTKMLIDKQERTKNTVSGDLIKMSRPITEYMNNIHKDNNWAVHISPKYGLEIAYSRLGEDIDDISIPRPKSDEQEESEE